MDDLREGIMGLFEEAQGLSRVGTDGLRLHVVPTHGGRSSFELARRADARKHKRERVKHEPMRRALRAAQRSVRLSVLADSAKVERQTCSRCGAVIERREGINRWQHVGVWYGQCAARSA